MTPRTTPMFLSVRNLAKTPRALWLLLGLGGVFLALGLLVSRLGASSEQLQLIAQERRAAEQIEGQMQLLVERRGTSALLYARTGEPSWEERQQTAIAELDAALRQATGHAPLELAERLQQSTQIAREHLATIEQSAVEFVGAGDLEQAQAVLLDDEHERWQSQYERALFEHWNAMARSYEARLKTARESASLSRGILQGSFLVLLMCAAFLIRRGTRDSDEHEDEATRQLRKESFVQALDNAPTGVVLTDMDTNITYANKSFAKLAGMPRESLVSLQAGLLRSGKTPDEVYQEMWKTLNEGKPWTGRLLNRHRTVAGEYENYWARLNLSPLLDEASECVGYIGFQQDVSGFVRLEEAQEVRRSLSAALVEAGAKLSGPQEFGERLHAALDEVMSVAGFREDLGASVMGEAGTPGSQPLVFAATHGFERHEWNDNGELERAVGMGESDGLQLFLGIDNDVLRDDGLAGFLLVPFGDETESRGLLVLGCDSEIVGQTDYSEMLDSLSNLFSRATLQWHMRNKLEGALAEANKANRAKSDFLANMSHEIRTPMTSILGYSELLLEADRSPDDREQAGRVIRQSAQELLALINGILDISKVESGSLELECMECSPLDVAKSVVAAHHEQAVSGNIKLEMMVEGAVPRTINSDPTRLRQVLSNLLDNAVKFTEIGGVTVLMRSEELDGKVDLIFEVKDTGIGIPAGQGEAMFDAFRQADISITRRFGGIGLGLTIARKLARLLGGDIALQSQEGHGANFSFRLPVGESQNLKLVSQGDPAITNFADTVETEESLMIPYRLLLAEDNVVNQRLIQRILEKAGAQVETVSNGAEAVDAVLAAEQASKPYDAVLMDLMMPEMDGLSATTSLRESGIELPIIALTADAMDGTSARCRRAGCDGYTTKPIKRAELFGLLCRLIEDRRVSH